MSGTRKLVKPKAGTGYAVEGKGPGILVLHAWWGLNDFFKSVCASLAREGFSSLALDLYHGRTTSDIEAAKLLRQSLDRQAAQQEIKSAVADLRESTGTQIGVIGFSMGGGSGTVGDG